MIHKILSSLSIFFLTIASAPAQWSSDPLNPLVFCDAINNQQNLISVEDGDGGLFTFWLDDRTGDASTEIYGQHFDSNGNILWEPNGKLIIDTPGDIRKVKAYHYDDDKLILVWYNNDAPVAEENTLSAQQIDDNGNKVWPEDLVVAHHTTGGLVTIWYFQEVDLVRDDFGFHIGFLIGNGGGYQYRISRFTESGILNTPLHGVGYGGNFNGTVRMTGDNNNRVYLFRPTGNGAGAPLQCVFLDTLATPVIDSWTTWMTVTDAPGLNYGYDAIADEGGITFVWEGEYTIKSNRIDTTGSFVWGEAPKILCTAAGNEIDFEFKQNNGDYYTIWKDSRPGIVGNVAIYGQRFDINGAMQWGETGAEIADMPTFNPFPKFTFDENNNLVVCHATTQGLGLRKHILSANGEQIIGGDGEDALTGNVQPNESDFNLIRLDDHIILYAMKYYPGDNNVFLTCVDGCQTTPITENVSACFEYTYNGEIYTESGTYEIELPGDTIVTLNLTLTSPEAVATLNGDTLINNLEPGNYLWWNCDTQTLVTDGNFLFIPEETGNYAFILEQNGCTDTTDCYFIDIVGVENLVLQNEITLYPNPSNDIMQLEVKGSSERFTLSIYDAMGNMVMTESMNSQKTQLSVGHFSNGTYVIVLRSNFSIFTKSFVKT